jgi:uncharacterized protein with von Willebrand factor type A (vWA) domain
MTVAAANRIERAIIEFCRFARESGLPTGVKESLDALRAAGAVGVANREYFKDALRAVLCSSRADWELFEEVFVAFWERGGAEPRLAGSRIRSSATSELQTGTEPALVGQSNAGETEGEGKAVLGASAQERLKKADFSELSNTDAAELERIALRLLEQMSLRLSRRTRKMAERGRVDLRRTIRRSIGHGGDPIDLSFRTRKLQQLKLVIVLDVSGSMNPYSVFLVRFAYALQKYFKRVDTFLFSTQLTEITAALRARQLREAMEALAQQAAGWAGGTKIGESLAELSLRHGRRLFSRDTVFILLSDGWETGDPAMLAEELSAIQRRVRKVLWLNPLLSMKGYEPITRGMSAALPFVDVFAPAHNLESLLELEGHLR